jgi:hypothetical protein
MIRRTYEWLLELPVAVVVGMMWLTGAALIGSLVIVLYWAVWELTPFLLLSR